VKIQKTSKHQGKIDPNIADAAPVGVEKRKKKKKDRGKEETPEKTTSIPQKKNIKKEKKDSGWARKNPSLAKGGKKVGGEPGKGGKSNFRPKTIGGKRGHLDPSTLLGEGPQGNR